MGELIDSPRAQNQATAGPAESDRPGPSVSIILPTYNRATFLPRAIDSIRSQTWTDWELIIVDDGSTDNTRELVARLRTGIPQRVRYLRQENRGAYGARNTGLDLATGEYIAFFDSDDVWLPHHLSDCARALAENPDVDWVYGACRVIDFASGKVVVPSTFYARGKPQPFMGLKTRPAGLLRVVEEPDIVRGALLRSMYSGLQNSVIRSKVFSGRRFRSEYRAETEDGMFLVRALGAGCRIAYYDNVHVNYYVHDDNSSGVSGKSVEKHVRIQLAFIRGYEELARDLPLTRAQLRALTRQVSRIFFWRLGYSLLWANGYRRQALAMFRRGLRTSPWNLWYWKTYLLALLRTAASAQAGQEQRMQRLLDEWLADVPPSPEARALVNSPPVAAQRPGLPSSL
jgi:glycosyltransferase involved in cell wall biosynthesis